MPATAWLRRNPLEIAWAALAAVNVAAMAIAPDLATIPFHVLWISLMIVYGIRVWSPAATAAALAAVVLATGLAIVPHAAAEGGWLELTEIPLMAAMFVVMVVYARHRQAALAAVQRAAEQQREFLRDASHQLRTPITIASGHAELVRMSLPEGQAAEDLDIVLEELDSLGRMARRLLVLDLEERTRVEASGPVELEAVLARTARRWRGAADRRWRVSVTAGAVAAGDAERIESALDALIENAVAVTSDGDEIVLSAHGEERHAVIEVSDSGPGIPIEHAERVFDRFYRLDGSPPGGRGLGLSIVRAIAQSHGGSVSVGASPAGGATFRISLPRPTAA